MTTTGITLSPTMLVAVIGVLLSLVLIWRGSARRARAAADAARAGARVVSLAGRVLFTAAVLVGVQWVVITKAGDPWVVLLALALPDLFAAHVLTRALTVTTLDTYTSRRGGRR